MNLDRRARDRLLMCQALMTKPYIAVDEPTPESLTRGQRWVDVIFELPAPDTKYEPWSNRDQKKFESLLLSRLKAH